MAAWRIGRWRKRGFMLVMASGLAATGVVTTAATSDSLPLAAAFGGGVHSYFAGDYLRAYDDLSMAIEGGSQDPRAWYFRGLAALKLGRFDEAEADFSAGAAHEIAGAGAWPVNRSLERVQGSDRLQLERHRTQARVAGLQEDHRRRKLRYLDVERAEPEVLRPRRPVEHVQPDATGPFSGGTPEAIEPVPAVNPAADKPVNPASDDPFAPAVSSQRSEQIESRASEFENAAGQNDSRREREAAEVENSFEQNDAQAERDIFR